MMKNMKAMVIFLVIALALVAGYYFFFAYENVPSYTYSATQQGVEVLSNDSPIIDKFNSLADQNDFVVLPQMFEQGGLNYYSSQGLSLLQVVLLSNKRNTVSMVKVYDAGNNFVYCQTNYGSEKVNEKISVENCQGFVQNSPAVKIEILFPNERLKKPYVTLEGNTVTIHPKVKEDIPGLSFMVAEAMYVNAPSVIGQFNYLADSAASSGGK